MPPSVTKRSYAVCIDPGHGGQDPGVVFNGVVEAELVAAYAAEIQTELEARGHKVVCTRGASENGKRKVTFKERAEVARRLGADFVISLHVNAAVDPNGAPLETRMGAIAFYAPTSDLAKKLAQEIEFRFPAKLRTGQYRVQPATPEAWPRVYNCLSQYAAPSVLLELGFATNKDDAFLLSQPDTIRAVVKGIADGIEVMGRPSSQIPDAPK